MTVTSHGAVAIQAPDSAGEIFDVDGCDISGLQGAPIRLYDRVIGRVTRAYKLRDAVDCKSDLDARILEYAPAVVIDAELDNDVAPLAGFAVFGTLLEREGPLLKKSALLGVSLTNRPVHPAYSVTLTSVKP